MTAPTHSYRKVSYDLRPAKQIERRMMIDAFQILMSAGFNIRNYKYVGFGSIYFVDFILFHKLLGIDNLKSIEHDPEAMTRCEFNKPFGNVELEQATASEVIPNLKREVQHIIWLDYDGPLDSEKLADVRSATSVLSSGSVLIVTVEGEPPRIEDQTAGGLHAHYAEEAKGYFEHTWTYRNFTPTNFETTMRVLINKSILSGLYGRSGISFFPIFNFRYADGKTMLTIGGVIGEQKQNRLLNRCDFSRAQYIRRSLLDDPCEISVPRLTRKERSYLDSFMPVSEKWRPSKFSLPASELAVYREIYRFFPTYAELLVG